VVAFGEKRATKVQKMAMKLPASVAYFTNIKFNESFTHHYDSNRTHSDSSQFKIKLNFHNTDHYKTD